MPAEGAPALCEPQTEVVFLRAPPPQPQPQGTSLERTGAPAGSAFTPSPPPMLWFIWDSGRLTGWVCAQAPSRGEGTTRLLAECSCPGWISAGPGLTPPHGRQRRQVFQRPDASDPFRSCLDHLSLLSSCRLSCHAVCVCVGCVLANPASFQGSCVPWRPWTLLGPHGGSWGARGRSRAPP